MVRLDSSRISNTFTLNIKSLEIKIGETLGILGLSGSGKTTLAKLISGLHRPQRGNSIKRKDGLKVGMVFQFPEDQFFLGSIGEDISLGPAANGVSELEIRTLTEDSLESVGLDPQLFIDRHFRSLSGGERRRAAIACILALKPELLILDEPTAGLDGIEVERIIRIIRDIRSDMNTTVVISQDSYFIAEVVDRVIALEEGNLSYDGDPYTFFSDRDVLKSIGVEQAPALKAIENIMGKVDGLNIDGVRVKDVMRSLENLGTAHRVKISGVAC